MFFCFTCHIMSIIFQCRSSMFVPFLSKKHVVGATGSVDVDIFPGSFNDLFNSGTSVALSDVLQF